MAVGFLSLSDELMALIFEQICLMDTEALRDLCLVSKQFYRLASPALYRSVVLTASKLKISDVTDAASCWSNLRTKVIVFTRDIVIQEGGLDWALLAELLSEMRQLDSIRWSSWEEPIPELILESLTQHWPSTILHVEDLPIGHKTEDTQVQRHDLEILDTLLGCQNIQSVKANINYEHPASTRRLKEVLMSCPKLEVLHLRIPRKDVGLRWSSDWPGPQDFGVEPGDRLVPLRELVYESRPLYGRDGLIPKSFWDFTRLRHLEIRGIDMINFVKSIPGQITCLETLKIENFCCAEEWEVGAEVLNDFMSEIHGLVNLELINPIFNRSIHRFLSILTQQSETLERLTFRKPRRCCAPYSVLVGNPFSVQSLDILGASCSKLSSLTLDIIITDDLPYDFLSAVARFRNLDTIRLYARFDNEAFDAKYRPLLQADILTVRHLASYLCSHKTGTAFKKIEVILGEAPRVPYYVREEERPDIIFRCRIEESGDVIVEDDSHEIDNVKWAEYLDRERLSKKRGRTYPIDLEELENWNRAGEEADQIFAGVGVMDVYENLGSLFGSSQDSEPEVEE